MNNRINIAAFTDSGIYPQYVSINSEPDGSVSITVRSKRTAPGHEGATATAILSAEQWTEIAARIAECTTG